jgi:hypothetical protein
MGRRRFSTILIGINVGLVLLAVAGVALAASWLLQQLADEHGLARVTQAAAVAHREILGAGEDAAVTAQLLAERPTLRRLLQENDRPALEAFLEWAAPDSRRHQRRAVRGTPGAGAARRDRGRGDPPDARHGARQYLT